LERSNFKLSESVIKATANNGFLKVSNRREGHSFLGGTLPSSWFTVKLDVILGGSISKSGAPTNLIIHNVSVKSSSSLFSSWGT
jgi:hypothetical protein